MVPPFGRADVGAGDFLAVGRRFADHFVALGGLAPGHRVLDMGCGVGRMAVPLTAWLRPPGSYDGIDVRRADIAWCRRHITRRHPRFRFHHAAVHHPHYNPLGRVAASEYRFPFPDDAFDFVIATSLFTHLLPAAAERYLAEVRRVLAPGGTLAATFFLLDETAAERIAAGRSPLTFLPAAQEPALVEDLERPEAAVAYPAAVVVAALARHGLPLARPVLPGGWSGRPDACEYQDLVFAARPGGPATAPYPPTTTPPPGAPPTRERGVAPAADA
jgi:SAM-dependent methyltransferase